MKRHVSGALMAALVLVASACTEDPLVSLRAGPKRLLLSASTLTVNVADSVAVTATALDDQGNPLPDAVATASSAPTVVSVSSANGAPLPGTKFFVKGLLFGSAYVRATVGSVVDSIKVITYPASVTITTNPTPLDSLGSGTTATFTANPLSATGQPVVGITTFTWSTANAAIAAVSGSGATVTITGATPGAANITVNIPGGVSTVKPVLVVAGPFNGTISATSGNSYDVITATAAGGGPPYDADMAALLDGVPLYASGTTTASTFRFAVPPVTATGAKQLTFTNIGPGQLAQRQTFTVNSTSLNDAYEPANDDPATAPLISANGDYFINLHGDCHPDNPATDGGLPHGPGDDCDDFFTITNVTGAPISVTVRAEWREVDADADLLWCNAACTALVGNTAGATGANPENSTVTIPAATTWRLYFNLYDGTAVDYAFIRVRVSGLP